MPSASAAAAVNDTGTPTGSAAPAAGLVTETVGAPALTAATVTLTAALGVRLPCESVATAVSTTVPTPAGFQAKL